MLRITRLGPRPPVTVLILLVAIHRGFVVNQVPLAVYTFFFIPRPGIDYRSVGQHRAPLIRYIQYIAMAFLALLVFK